MLRTHQCKQSMAEKNSLVRGVKDVRPHRKMRRDTSKSPVLFPIASIMHTYISLVGPHAGWLGLRGIEPPFSSNFNRRLDGHSRVVSAFRFVGHHGKWRRGGRSSHKRFHHHRRSHRRRRFRCCYCLLPTGVVRVLSPFSGRCQL